MLYLYEKHGFSFFSRVDTEERFSATHLVDKSEKPKFYEFCIKTANPNVKILSSLEGVKNKDNIDLLCTIHNNHFKQQLSEAVKYSACSECIKAKAGIKHAKKVREDFIESLRNLPEHIKVDLDVAMEAETYDSRFTAHCIKHGEFETSRRGLKSYKFICPHCSTRDADNPVKLNTKERFLTYIQECDRGYDYSLCEFKGVNKKVKIICQTHGVFHQTPRNHMIGYGCVKCGLKQASITKVGLGYGNNFGRSSYKTKSGNSFVYVFRITSHNESFYKIGIAADLKGRIYNIKRDVEDYDCEVIFSHLTDCTSAWDIEKMLHFDHKQFRYMPKHKFKGSTECFSEVDLDSVSKLILYCM